MSYVCDSCDREFYSWNAVRQHMDARDHWRWPYECETCDKRFGSQDGAAQHMNALRHWATDSSSSEAQEEDDDDEDEFECDKCDRIFSSWDACRQHMNALDHWWTDECSTCSRRFVNRHALEQHMDALGHRSSHYCSSCERHFKNPSDLFQHMNSPIHLRASSTHAAPASPIRSTATPQSASTVPSAPVASVSSTLAANPSALPSTPSQPSSRPPAPPPAASSKSAWLSVLGQTVISAPTTLYTLLSSSDLPSMLPINTGTISAPFRVCIEKDTAASINSHYQSITFMQPCLAFSFEELRLADYRAGRKPASPGLQTTAFGRHVSLISTPSVVATTASATVNVRPDYQDKYTQTETSRPQSSLYFSATSSRATTPDITAVTTPTKSSISKSSIITTVPTQKTLTALAVDDDAKLLLSHEAHSEMMRLIKGDDGKLEWVSQGYGPIRMLVSNETLIPRVLMHADPPSKFSLNFNVLLDTTLYVIKARTMVRFNIPIKNTTNTESFMCRFEDEVKAIEFLDKLHKAIARARASPNDHPSFSLSEIKMLHTEPVEKPEVIDCLTCQNQHAKSMTESQIINCPFCRLSFFAVSEVIQHLEATSCPARPDLNRRNIYHFWLQDLATIQGQGYQIVDMQVQEPLYHCFSTTGKCDGKSFSSLAGLHGHLESEDCDYTDREQLRDAVGNFENLIPPFRSC